MSDQPKAVVHISGTLLRRNWFGQELTNCIVVRPAGYRRDTEGYVVHQVKFTGPSELVFSAQPREAKNDRKLSSAGPGFVRGWEQRFNTLLIEVARPCRSVVFDEQRG